MIRFLYGLAMRVFGLGARFAAPFHDKTAQWLRGRKKWEKRLRSQLTGDSGSIWVHCSSLGEFEQGRPVIEALYDQGEKVILTFFSPSGYNHAHHFNKAKVITYIPLDTKTNAKRFLDIVQPKAVLFVKYEFWFNFIGEIHQHHIPLYLVSGILRPEQYFFKSWAGWFASQLRLFSGYFAQDAISADLAKKLGIQNVTVSGDTRFDRVLKILSEGRHILELEFLKSEAEVIVAGSTWKEDEELLLTMLQTGIYRGKLILAPHEVHASRIADLKNRCPEKTICFSEFKDQQDWQVMIVDRIGFLSRMYRYATLAYIGGGFGKGIHNSLEAAVYGLPVIFGPNYHKFREAKELIAAGGAFSVKNAAEMKNTLERLKDPASQNEASESSRRYVAANAGATDIILNALESAGIIAQK